MSEFQQGGGYLIEKAGSRKIQTPEGFSDEQKELYRNVFKFTEEQVLPLKERIDNKEEGLMLSILKKAGEELGLFMIDIPEKYGGLAMDKTSSMLAAEACSFDGSFAVSVGAHVGIGTLPIVWFGNEQTKAKYLPKSATGEWIGAYALTESGSGSDALAAKSKAVLSSDGKFYILNGTKQFITNAGFADYFIVFAKIDGEKFTGFVVDRNTPGLTIEPEEHKMGINGSSTCALTFEDCKVPVENVLGEIGKGHRIAFNILNVGRLKLGVGAIGGAKYMLKEAILYAKERKQFGVPIITFGALKQYVAEMAAYIFAAESLVYRTAGLIDAKAEKLDKNSPKYDDEVIKIIEEYVVEASIGKVYGSECLDFVVDRGLQMFGGYGYSEEYPAARGYRDARINRIFEGTNEINRLLIPGMLLKHSMKQMIDLMTPIQNLNKALEGNKLDELPLKPEGNDLLSTAIRNIEMAKRICLYASNTAIMKYMMELEKQQMILFYMADMMIETYAGDSAISRALQAKDVYGADDARAKVMSDMASLTAASAYTKCWSLALELVSAVAKGKELDKHIDNLDKLWVRETTNRVELKERIAAYFVEKEKYLL
ncbi:MAG: acyl-CoA dehydrogenase family protein [Myxococcota bacterium]